MGILREIFNPSTTLQEAALNDSAWGVKRLMGRAERANVQVNSEALRVAAENKSYNAFAQLLKTSLERSWGCALPTTPDSFMYGNDWSRVEELAKQDPRIGSMMERYSNLLDQSVDLTIEMFKFRTEQEAVAFIAKNPPPKF